MAARGSRDTQRARAQAERARIYAARAAWHERSLSRRRRDTFISVLVGAVIVIGAVVSQALHAQVTVPTSTPSPGPAQTSGE